MVDDIFYLIADLHTQTYFQERGLSTFSYQHHGKNISMSYFKAPNETLENPEDMKEWAVIA